MAHGKKLKRQANNISNDLTPNNITHDLIPFDDIYHNHENEIDGNHYEFDIEPQMLANDNYVEDLVDVGTNKNDRPNSQLTINNKKDAVACMEALLNYVRQTREENSCDTEETNSDDLDRRQRANRSGVNNGRDASGSRSRSRSRSRSPMNPH